MAEIETERLHFRNLTWQDLDDLARIYQDPEVMKYRLHPEPATREQTQEMLEKILSHWQQYNFGRWAVICSHNQQLIGHCGLEVLAGTSEVEVNYLLDRTYWGKGLATEAAREALRYGFEELGCDRLVAIAKPENIASRRVMEKAGMQYEKDIEYYGVSWVYYKLKRDQWKASSNGSDF